MAGRHSQRVWRGDPFRYFTDLDAEYRFILDTDFWLYVDSQQNSHPHPEECHEHPTIFGARTWVGWDGQERVCRDYRHHRDADYCIAANSHGNQCNYPGVLGLPFCDFHFDNVWKYMLAAVSADRQDSISSQVESRLRHKLESFGLTQARVMDAEAALARQPERVYFFRAGHAVKVGRSIHPEKRVRTLKGTKAPEGVDVAAGELLGTIPGGCKTESALHLQFRPHRLIGEWFEYGPVADAIANLLTEPEEAAA